MAVGNSEGIYNFASVTSILQNFSQAAMIPTLSPLQGNPKSLIKKTLKGFLPTNKRNFPHDLPYW